MDKRKCLKCNKVKIFSNAMGSSLVCKDCLPSEENVEKANEVIRKHFSELGKKSWASRKEKMLKDSTN